MWSSGATVIILSFRTDRSGQTLQITALQQSFWRRKIKELYGNFFSFQYGLTFVHRCFPDNSNRNEQDKTRNSLKKR